MNVWLGAILISVLLLSGCQNTYQHEELAKLSAFQKQEQSAHLTNNPNLLLSMMTDSLMQVKSGRVQYFTKPQLKERFTSYFKAVQFVKWDDTAPPVYTISPDGQMATVLVQKRVELREISDTSGTIQKTDFVWLELWKKVQGNWRMYGNISTHTTAQ